MLKRLGNVVLASILAISLTNCGANSVNTIANNIKPVTLSIDIKDLVQQDISEIKIDGKILEKSEYKINNQQLILPELSIGRHVLKISHKTLGEVELPLEIKKESNNNFQFTPLIKNQKIQSWEAGTDENKDGLIDTGSYFSKDFQTYVVVRDSSGKLNYLPKTNLSSDFRENLNPEKPANFNFPDLKENELKSSDTQQLPSSNTGKNSQITEVNGDILDYPFPGNTALNLQNNLSNIKGYKVSAITSESILFPVSTYLIKNNYLVLDNYTYKDQKVLKLYLTDESGKNYMLKIDILVPFGNNSSTQNTNNVNLPTQPVYSQNPPPPPDGLNHPPNGAMPPPHAGQNPPNPPADQNMSQNQNTQNQQTASNTVTGIAPAPSADGKPQVDYMATSNLKFTVFNDVALTEAEFKKLTVFEVVVNPARPPQKTKKVYITLPDNNGYAEIKDDGTIINYFTKEYFKPEADATILPAK